MENNSFRNSLRLPSFTLNIICCRNKKDKNGIPVFAEVELEKDLLKNDGLSYRYCFFRKGNKSPENEFLFRNYYPYHNGFRKLKIPAGLGNWNLKISMIE